MFCKEGAGVCDTGGVIVQCKFYNWQLFHPVSLVVISEKLQVLFQALVCSFCGSISLQSVRSREMLLNIQDFADCLPKMAHKLRPLI